MSAFALGLDVSLRCQRTDCEAHEYIRVLDDSDARHPVADLIETAVDVGELEGGWGFDGELFHCPDHREAA